MSPISNCPNRACELMPSSSNMAFRSYSEDVLHAPHPSRRTLRALIGMRRVSSDARSAGHQRAAAFLERTERLRRRNGGTQIVQIPRTLRLFRLLHLEQIHVVDLAAVGPHRALAE